MTVYFSNYVNRIKSVKKTAYEKHANFSLSFLNAVGLSYLLSWKLSFYSWVYLGNFEFKSCSMGNFDLFAIHFLGDIGTYYFGQIYSCNYPFDPDWPKNYF